MKNTKLILLTFVVGLVSFGMIDSATTKEKTSEPITWEQMLEEERLKKEIEELRIKEYHEDELQRFLHDIGHRESGNRYDITNTWGYMGRYQFGKATLKGLGYNVTKKEFLNNPQLQDSAMIDLLNHNKEKLQSYIDIYDGKTINGMEITESGILAAAHLGGQGSVKRYFRNGKVFRDGNGTKITSYMKQFSGYDIKLN
jgi:hypothetical protein